MTDPQPMSTSSAGLLALAIDAIEAAEVALARSSKLFPEVGSCPIRAVIDVERANLRHSRQHVLAAARASQEHQQ
jgi:hypothetical protein